MKRHSRADEHRLAKKSSIHIELILLRSHFHCFIDVIFVTLKEMIIDRVFIACATGTETFT
jgi:hypothetical protein